MSDEAITLKGRPAPPTFTINTVQEAMPTSFSSPNVSVTPLIDNTITKGDFEGDLLVKGDMEIKGDLVIGGELRIYGKVVHKDKESIFGAYEIVDESDEGLTWEELPEVIRFSSSGKIFTKEELKQFYKVLKRIDKKTACTESTEGIII